MIPKRILLETMFTPKLIPSVIEVRWSWVRQRAILRASLAVPWWRTVGSSFDTNLIQSIRPRNGFLQIVSVHQDHFILIRDLGINPEHDPKKVMLWYAINCINVNIKLCSHSILTYTLYGTVIIPFKGHVFLRSDFALPICNYSPEG